MHIPKSKPKENKNKAKTGTVKQNKVKNNQLSIADNRLESIVQGKLQKGMTVSQRVVQFDWPRVLNTHFAEQLVREVLKEKGIEYSKKLGDKYIPKIMYDDDQQTKLTGWGSRESIIYYLKNAITEEAEKKEEVEYVEIVGTYGTIPQEMVKILVEDYSYDTGTLETAVNRITSSNAHWNYVRRLGSSSSELKLGGTLKGLDKRVFAGSDQKFNTIGKALH